MPEQAPVSIVSLLIGPDKPGLVAGVSGWIFERGGNIVHADQHDDHDSNIFFQRIEWLPSPDSDPKVEAREFEQMAKVELGMNVRTALSTDRPKVAIFVSKTDHCFHDLILRFKAGEMQGELACVISNHETLRVQSAGYDLPFYHVPVEDKEKAESEQVAILKKHNIQLVALARYMQVLSDHFLENCGCPVINIHHSFLPAFAGAKPYHQAHRRGVKLIGATAHYATQDLDEGPIIAQDVSHVSHRHGPKDLIRHGRDLEKRVFAQAVRWHLENRILRYNNKTVVFD